MLKNEPILTAVKIHLASAGECILYRSFLGEWYYFTNLNLFWHVWGKITFLRQPCRKRKKCPVAGDLHHDFWKPTVLAQGFFEKPASYNGLVLGKALFWRNSKPGMCCICWMTSKHWKTPKWIDSFTNQCWLICRVCDECTTLPKNCSISIYGILVFSIHQNG